MEQQNNISSDLIRGHIDTIILHALLNGDKFAQQISDSIEEKSEKEYKINQATLYSSLKRLESLKFVQSYWNDSDSGRRKYFRLTESGKSNVELNLSNWSYSRAVIDKLMDCAPQPIYRTQYVEKIVEIPKEVTVEKIINVSPEKQIENSNFSEISSVKETEKSQALNNENNFSESVQEINFRNILSGLIKSTTVQHTADAEQLIPLNKQEVIEEKNVVKQKFNDTIILTDYNAERNNNGKIDFGDLTLKAIKEGYKLRISSKDSCVAKGTILINKLNFVSSIISLMLALASLFLITFVLLKNETFSNPVAIIGTIIFALYPLFTAIKYVIAPKKTSAKQISADSILTTAIVVFDLILITVAINLLINLDFSAVSTVAFSMILPIVLFVLAIIYFVVRFLLSKMKFFKIQVK